MIFKIAAIRRVRELMYERSVIMIDNQNLLKEYGDGWKDAPDYQGSLISIAWINLKISILEVFFNIKN